MTTLTVRVDKITQEACDIKSFELRSVSGEALPAFTPGSHIDVHMGEGLIRQYSLCNGPDDIDRYLIAVKKEVTSRGGSQTMHEGISVGDLIKISAPRNNFPLEQSQGPYLLLAGGIGVTPVLSMARHLLAQGVEFELQYFTRSIAHTAFHKLLSGPEFQGRVKFHYALEPEGLRAYLRKLLWNYPENGALYLCGPRVFMDLVETTAAATWPPQAVHLEYFSADPLSLAGEQESFEVRLARTGGTYAIPAGMPITEALAAHGIHIDTSCEQGVCGTCLTGVLEGTPDHRDVYLSDAEKKSCDKIMPCVSRAKSPLLVLDL
ncbi:MAG: PDR/VanB family oxidoreductase [Burkholderiaceae bacterium]|uniref:Oxidoreductase n=1 Tax=Herminiimonas contaminans TaxID=1111140 RepID=A0ABS0EVP6_9BURK|nr:PDR/VanB family oxidoreductase [Herminiimonas contaminans]MBF8178804.1 oxidoreductase [Herminiimonas contaminans]MBX9798420.1 PDR/VanB family oxidoreductase [Burkholderiaceae bacterium]